MKTYNPNTYIHHPLEKTALHSLYTRHCENLAKNPILKDDHATQLITKIDFDFALFKDGRKNDQLVSAIRSQLIDQKVLHFIQQKTNPIIVNIGCGLDTRFERLGMPQHSQFYQVDFESVIDFRRMLMKESANNQFLSVSVHGEEWLRWLASKHGPNHFMFILEDVSMYFTAQEINLLIQRLSILFNQSEILIDVISPIHTQTKFQSPSITKLGARWTWGLKYNDELLQSNTGLNLLEAEYYRQHHYLRWGAANIFQAIPMIANSQRLLHLAINYSIL